MSIPLLPIPTDWTPAQAEAVLDFLVRLADAVYAAYQAPLAQRAERDARGLPDDSSCPSPDHSPDLIPF